MELPNFTYLGKGFYVCRTQAGFNQALRHFTARDPAELRELDGYPLSYPSFVSFSWGYRGYHYPIARCMNLKELRADLDQSDPV